MTILQELELRSDSKCELCNSNDDLKALQIKPVKNGGIDEHLLTCFNCRNQIENPDKTDINHWRCLNESMWSEFDAVKVVAWRIVFVCLSSQFFNNSVATSFSFFQLF